MNLCCAEVLKTTMDHNQIFRGRAALLPTTNLWEYQRGNIASTAAQFQSQNSRIAEPSIS